MKAIDRFERLSRKTRIMVKANMKFTDWAMQQIARCTYAEGRDDMKVVYVLVRGKNPVRFYAGDGKWATSEAVAKLYPSKEAARGAAYDMQAQFQATIVPEGVYRLANTALTCADEGGVK